MGDAVGEYDCRNLDVGGDAPRELSSNARMLMQMVTGITNKENEHGNDSRKDGAQIY